jgi:L-serine/L-threonine ammonia-lyase
MLAVATAPVSSVVSELKSTNRSLSEPMTAAYSLPYIASPLVPSLYLSELIGAKVLLKLETVQPSGSFKSRGLGTLVHHTVSNAPPGSLFHFFSPSGGNAGCATAYASRLYGQKCTVCVPSVTKKVMIERIRKTGATVVVHGDTIAEADKYLREVLMPASEEPAIYCHPYDNPLVWQGNSTLATELIDQLKGTKPDAVLCSVGGGGLYNGLVLGFRSADWNDIPIIAVETEGCEALNLSLKNGGEQVFIEKPNTIASSLSTATVTKETIDYALNVQPTYSTVVTDAEAAESCIRFAEDHKLLVEAACGAALAPLYSRRINNILPDLNENSVVVVIVCGGTSVNWDILRTYADTFNINL